MWKKYINVRKYLHNVPTRRLLAHPHYAVQHLIGFCKSHKPIQGSFLLTLDPGQSR